MQDKFILYQQNVFPAMLDDLAERLNVSVETIEKLGVGFNPDYQSWVFAERDTQGNIIGLVERMPNDKKIMVKGSKRGLTYQLASCETKKKSYAPGRHNWHRATKEHPCPMCGKSGECLLSAENPADPAAVLCAHVVTGAVQHRATTHLHIRKEDGKVTSSKPYPKSDLPILVVEGASDVLAAMELGFVAIGRPSAQGGIETLVSLLRGEDVIVIGEIETSGVGILGMEAVFAALQPVCKSVKKVLPPDGIKDLREWNTKQKLTSASLLEYIEQHPEIEGNKAILNDTSPLHLARQWLEETQKGLLCRWQDDWWKYNGHCYKVVEQDILIQELYLFLEDKLKYNVKQQLVPYNADKSNIQNILHALIAVCHLRNKPEEIEPFYIRTNGQLKQSFDGVANILFKNGVYNIYNQKLQVLTPQLFNTSTLPYAYNPKAECPLWIKFINDIFNGDTENIELLQQWMGYNLIASNSMEKIMIFLGPPASGKSTIADVMEALLGSSRTAAITLKTLDSEFGLAPLIGKYAAFLAEAYVSRRMDGMEILQRLKRITGRDTVNINRKYKSTVSTKLFTRITYVANELPQFLDNPQALRRRAVILTFPNSYEENPDITLKRKLCKEVQGIANWAMAGLKSLQEQRQFIIPQKSLDAFTELKRTTCPLYGAIEECCEFHPESFAAKDQLFDVCQAWLKENGHYQISKVKFGRIIKTMYIDKIAEVRPLIQGHRIRGYNGIVILPEAKERYLG